MKSRAHFFDNDLKKLVEEEIRAKWISCLYLETIQAAILPQKRSIILNNWLNSTVLQTWLSPCKRTHHPSCSPNDCIWASLYAKQSHLNRQNPPEILTPSQCHVYPINDFLLWNKSKKELSDRAMNGLLLMLEFFQVNLWYEDEINCLMHPFDLTSSSPADNVHIKMGHNDYSIGKGSTGYAFRKQKGICVSDALADPRGVSSFADMILGSYSYIGSPINDNGKTIGYITLAYPLLGSWHPEMAGFNCPKCFDYDPEQARDSEMCFYEKFHQFLHSKIFNESQEAISQHDIIHFHNKTLETSIKLVYHNRLSAKLSQKILDATNVGANMKPNFKHLLNHFCVQEDAQHDGLDVNYASIWELDPYGEFVKRQQMIAQQIALKHLKKVIIQKNRYVQQEGAKPLHSFQLDQYDDLLSLDSKQINTFKIMFEDIRFEVLCDCPLTDKDKNNLKKILESRYNSDLTHIIKLVAYLVDIGVQRYKKHFSNHFNPACSDVNIVQNKLRRFFLRLFIICWINGNQRYYANMLDNIYAFLGSVDADTRRSHDAFINLVKKHLIYKEPLIAQLKKSVNNHFLYLHVWINFETNFNEKLFRLAFYDSSQYKPYRLFNALEKQVIIRNFINHCTYKVFDYAANYLDDGQLINLTEGPYIISNKWSNFLSNYFNFLTFLTISKDHKCGILFNGTEQEAESFVQKAKALLKAKTLTNKRIETLMDYLSDNMPETKNAFLLFHLRQTAPWYYIFVEEERIPTDRKEKLQDFPIQIENSIKDIVELLEDIEKGSIPFDARLPLFYWNVYKKEGERSWDIAPQIREAVKDNRDRTEKIETLLLALNQTYFHTIGAHALFAYLLNHQQGRSAKKSKPIGLFLLGRQTFHPEEYHYAAFSNHQLDIVNIFLNLASGWLGLEQYYKQSEIKETILGESTAISAVRKQVEHVAKNAWPALILGESGVGKELVADAIHKASARANQPYQKVNCGVMTETLIESELFGYKKGAFTDAVRDKTGQFEAANGGAIFLDEIGDAPEKLQVALLRVIESNEVVKIGDLSPKKINVKIICATNKNLQDEIKNKKFRNDLFHRINVLPIYVPPLRERKEDIPILANYFIQQVVKESKDPDILISGIDHEGIELLKSLDYKGNVRELKNLILRAITLCRGKRGELTYDDIKNAISLDKGEGRFKNFSLSELLYNSPFDYFFQTKGQRLDERASCLEMEKETLLKLERTAIRTCLADPEIDGNVALCAQKMGLNRVTLYDRLKEYGINWKDFNRKTKNGRK